MAFFRLKMVFFGIAFSMTPAAMATGGISEGGGKSVVCRNQSGAVTKAQLLDLYEGRSFWGLHIPESNEPVNLQIDRAVAKLNKDLGATLRVVLKEVQMAIHQLGVGDKLVAIHDSFHAIIPPCAVDQLANFFNPSHIAVDSEIWNQLSLTGKAALMVHEALYYLEREFGLKDSRHTRRIVAELFSDRNVFAKSPNEGVPVGAVDCWTGDRFPSIRKAYTHFYYFNDGNDLVLQFLRINGEVKLMPTRIRISSMNWDSLVMLSAETEAAFEAGDHIHLVRTEPEQKPPLTSDFTLEGFSGWLPGQSIPKLKLHCSR